MHTCDHLHVSHIFNTLLSFYYLATIKYLDLPLTSCSQARGLATTDGKIDRDNLIPLLHQSVI